MSRSSPCLVWQSSAPSPDYLWRSPTRQRRSRRRCSAAAAGDRTAQNAPAAWEAATRATFTWPAVACVACAVFTVPAELLTLHYGPIPTWQLFLVLVPVVQFGILATSILAYFTGEAFLRPIVAEISDCLPADFEPRGWTPKLRSRLLPAVLVVDIFASILAGGLVSHAASPAEALVFSLAAGLAINLTFSLVWVMALSGSIIGPVKHLSVAAKAVERGDLRGHVPLFGKDELTDLSRAFNQMVDGLAERREAPCRYPGIHRPGRGRHSRIERRFHSCS